MGIIWDWYRFFLHLPLGIAAYRMAKKSPMAALSLVILFIVYELNEDDYIKDHAYKDLQGMMAGMIVYLLKEEVIDG